MAKADVLISPCCYGSIRINQNDSITYPRSKMFKNALESLHSNKNFYLKLKKFADRTEKNIEYEKNAYLCMSYIDSDRLIYLKENGYNFIQLNKMQPETCTTKNNLLLAKFC